MHLVGNVFLTLLASLCLADVDFRTDMLGEVEFSSHGTSDVALVMLTDAMGIVCYADWTNPEDGHCNPIDFSSPSAPIKGQTLVLHAGVKSQRFTLSRFSDTLGVVCYTPFGGLHGRPRCSTLTLSGSGSAAALSKGDDFEFNPVSAYSYSIAVASLTETIGVVCYQDTSDVFVWRRDLACQVLNVDGTTVNSPHGNLTIVNERSLSNIMNVSLARISESAGVVCYMDQDQLKAYCNRLSVEGQGAGIGVGPQLVLSGDRPCSLSVAALSDSRGVACYCGGGSGDDSPTCVPLGFAANSTEVFLAGGPLALDGGGCSEVSLTGMSETGAVVCYLRGGDKVGTCSGLVLNHGHTLTAGDASDIGDSGSGAPFVEPDLCSTNECERWISVSRSDGANAVACFGGVDGSESGRCRGLSLPPPTSTTTPTTTSETSSTTPHTTTETSTSTATKTATLTSKTTHSATTVTSSTTPHTTTGTTATIPAESGAARTAQAARLAASLVVLALCALQTPDLAEL